MTREQFRLDGGIDVYADDELVDVIPPDQAFDEGLEVYRNGELFEIAPASELRRRQEENLALMDLQTHEHLSELRRSPHYRALLEHGTELVTNHALLGTPRRYRRLERRRRP